MKSRNRLPVFLGVLALLMAILIFLALNASDDSEETVDGGERPGAAAIPPRSLADVPQSRFMSIFVSDAEGSLASYMVGGDTPEFDGFAEAIANAQPVPGISDETFSDLLVVSFGTNDTLELSYSRSLNQFMFEDVLYEPRADLSPMIAVVERKFE